MNRQTRSLAKRGLSLKFHRGVNGTGDSSRPEITLVSRPQPTRGVCINSSLERKNHKKRPYEAPTRKAKGGRR